MGNDLRALALALVVATAFLGTFAGASSADVNPKPPDASFYDWDWRIIIRVKDPARFGTAPRSRMAATTSAQWLYVSGTL